MLASNSFGDVSSPYLSFYGKIRINSYFLLLFREESVSCFCLERFRVMYLLLLSFPRRPKNKWVISWSLTLFNSLQLLYELWFYNHRFIIYVSANMLFEFYRSDIGLEIRDIHLKNKYLTFKNTNLLRLPWFSLYS